MPPTLTLIAPPFGIDVVVRVASLALNPVHRKRRQPKKNVSVPEKNDSENCSKVLLLAKLTLYSRKNCASRVIVFHGSATRFSVEVGRG